MQAETVSKTMTQSKGMTQSRGYAATSPKSALTPFEFQRRPVEDHDILINIKYCGVCHSDIHQARNEWKASKYPMVPGHEIVGEVAKVGRSVTKFKVGDRAGVGCFVDSCRKCDACLEGDEQFCANAIDTYNSPEGHMGGLTYGGYSNNIVVDENYALKVSPKANLASTAPLLCAGITTFSPLKHWKVGPGQKVGIVGLGGLGHMGVKLAHSMGAHVFVFSRSEGKKTDAMRLGAEGVILSTDSRDMEKHRGSFDFILDTVAANHDIDALLAMLKRNGSMVIVGLPVNPHSFAPFSIIRGRKTLAGSMIGGIAENQEMLDYCAAHGITADIELIPIQKINEAFERTVKGDIKYRFVIDMTSLGK